VCRNQCVLAARSRSAATTFPSPSSATAHRLKNCFKLVKRAKDAPELGHPGLLDYHRAAEAIKEGREATERALPMITRQLQNHG
jgi:hypothetical protein